MSTLDYRQANSNLSFPQTGSAGVERAGIVVGAKDGEANLYSYKDLRYALASGVDYFVFEEHFLGNQGATTVPSPLKGTLTALGTTATVSGEVGGIFALTTKAEDNAYVTVALDTNFTCENGWLFFKSRVNLIALTDVVLEVGLSDAISETAGLAFSSHTLAGVTDVATDAVVFAFDSAGETTWVVNTSKNGTPQAADTDVTPTANTYTEFEIRLNTAGTGYFYINDVLVATVENAITSTSKLTPWVSIVTTANAGVAKSVRLDYVGVLGSR
jgi:hypothetical protein